MLAKMYEERHLLGKQSGTVTRKINVEVPERARNSIPHYRDICSSVFMPTLLTIDRT